MNVYTEAARMKAILEQTQFTGGGCCIYIEQRLPGSKLERAQPRQSGHGWCMAGDLDGELHGTRQSHFDQEMPSKCSLPKNVRALVLDAHGDPSPKKESYMFYIAHDRPRNRRIQIWVLVT
jgi:hypothetical protein